MPESDRAPVCCLRRMALAAFVLIVGTGCSECRAVAQEFRPLRDVEDLFSREGMADQQEEHLETDRDSFTPATSVVGRGRTLLETSYSFIENRAVANSHSFPELLTRVGLTDRLELRLGGNVELGGGGSVSGTELGNADEVAEGESESNVLYGFKFAVSTQQDWLPRSALIVHATTPTSGPTTATQAVFGYVAGWTLPNGWDLDTSMRYVAASERGDHFNQWAPSVVLKVPVGERWTAHAEYFGIFAQHSEEDINPQYFSPGIHYLISEDCEIGIRTGWGLNHHAANFFSNVGLGVRF